MTSNRIDESRYNFVTDFKTESVTSFLKWLINNFKYKKTMNKEESKIVSVVGTCATIGATTVAGIATVVGAPVTITMALVGGAIGCLGGAIFTSLKNK